MDYCPEGRGSETPFHPRIENRLGLPEVHLVGGEDEKHVKVKGMRRVRECQGEG